ncbi:MAG: B12-binding domain-containing radical SAM protein [Firmicutes bacterium]|nr:B12-binding domain-containing radical SAM protein [Bacillota bacterium]
MKTAIIALNSKYIHSSLAPWYLKYFSEDCCGEIKVLEYTINDNIEWVLSKIFLEKPDVIALSCYIWSIDYILKLVSNLKKVLPHTAIILGGPEVSFDPEEIMFNNTFIDYIICGEGEKSFGKLLKTLQDGSIPIDSIEGLCYRNNKGKITYDGKYCLVDNLDSIPSPYTDEMFSALGNRIVYYEASRGCPFSCSYCISSTFEGVRYFSLDRVKRDICRFINAGVKQVKFVDRTFNANKKRAKEIIGFIIENSKNNSKDNNKVSGKVKSSNTCFHFEAAGDLFDDEMLDILAGAEEGLIQFEIGVQSVNEETLKEINRKTDIEKVFKNVNRLKSFGNIHLHLDLIAGLPFEDYSLMQKSFNKVYEQKPHQLQLGFLKMLKGSKIRYQAEKHGYSFRDYPPYEVLYNKYVNFDEMTEFKGIEEIFERYYNSGRFINSLNFVINRYFDSPFQFYKEFYLFNLKAGYLDRAIPGRELYTVFYDFVKNIVPAHERDVGNDLLKFDFLSTNNSGNLPDGITRIIEPELKEKRLGFLKDEKNRSRYFPGSEGMEAKRLLRNVNFEVFDYDVTELVQDAQNNLDVNIDNNIIRKKRTVILFNYTQRNRVTGLYKYYKVDL